MIKTSVRRLALFLWALLSPTYGLASVADTSANQLELIFYPAPTRLDWTTPGSMIRSVAHNWLLEWVESPTDWASQWFPWENYPHITAHVNVSLKCENGREFLGGMSQDWPATDVWRAVSGADSFDRLISQFPGYLIPEKTIQGWLKVLRPRDQARSLVMKLNPATCRRLVEYIDEYRARGYDKIYSGFVQDPMKGEGAGCAQFAMSFLRVAGLWSDQFDSRWKRVLHMSESMINMPGKPAQFTMLDILSGDDGSWTRTPQQIKLNIFDPHLMYDWVADVWEGRLKAPFTVARKRIGGSLALFADFSRRPSPRTPIWPNSLRSASHFEITK